MWIGLPLEEDGTHVTIVIRHDNPSEEVFKRILHEEIAPLLPIVLKVHTGKIIMRGYKGDVPTMDVEFLDRRTNQIIKDIYRRNYAQGPYPELVPHVTVKGDVKDGYVVMHATLKRIGENEIIDLV